MFYTDLKIALIAQHFGLRRHLLSAAFPEEITERIGNSNAILALRCR
jgi:hypothetical protein